MAMCWTFYLMFDALIFDSWLLQSEMQKPRSLMNERGFFNDKLIIAIFERLTFDTFPSIVQAFRAMWDWTEYTQRGTLVGIAVRQNAPRIRYIYEGQFHKSQAPCRWLHSGILARKRRS